MGLPALDLKLMQHLWILLQTCFRTFKTFFLTPALLVSTPARLIAATPVGITPTKPHSDDPGPWY